MKFHFAVACAALVVSGCATTPVPNGSTQEVGTQRLLDPTLAVKRPGTGVVLVKSDTGLQGAACSLQLSVDAKPAVQLKQAERVALHLMEGDHILTIEPVGICGGGIAEVAAKVAAGASTSFRVGYNSGGDLLIAPTAF